MRLVGDAMDWVPIQPPLRPVVLVGLGLEDAEPIRALAGIAEQDLLRCELVRRRSTPPPRARW